MNHFIFHYPIVNISFKQITFLEFNKLTLSITSIHFINPATMPRIGTVSLNVIATFKIMSMFSYQRESKQAKTNQNCIKQTNSIFGWC